jgi:hypothetical protein
MLYYINKNQQNIIILQDAFVKNYFTFSDYKTQQNDTKTCLKQCSGAGNKVSAVKIVQIVIQA